jgi:hypothetical protein
MAQLHEKGDNTRMNVREIKQGQFATGMLDQPQYKDCHVVEIWLENRRNIEVS